MSEQRPVALGIQGPYGGGGQGTDPLHPFSEMMNIQNSLNQQRLFQMQMQGRQRFGEIMAGSGSIDDKMNAALQDPVAAAFAPQLFHEYREGKLAMLQAQQVQQGMNLSGFDATAKGLSAVVANPNMYANQEQYHNMMNNRMSLLSRETQQNNAFAMGSIETQLYDGLPTEPNARAAELQHRATTLATSVMPPDQLRNILGLPAPGIQTVTLEGGKQVPGVVGGGLTEPPTVNLPGITGQPAPGTVSLPGITPAPGATTTSTPRPTAAGPAPQPGTIEAVALQPLPGELSVASPQPPPRLGQTTTQKAMAEKQSDADIEAVKDVNDLSRGLPIAANRVDGLMQSLRFFNSGGFTSGGMRAAQIAQGIGKAAGWDSELTTKLSDALAGGNLADAQYFASQISNQAIEEVKQAIIGTGRAMRPEIDNALRGLSVDMDKRMLWHYLNDRVMPIVQRGYDITAKFPRYRQAIEENRLPNWHISDINSFETQHWNRQDAPQITSDGIRLGWRNPNEMNAEIAGPPASAAPLPPSARPAAGPPPPGGPQGGIGRHDIKPPWE